MNKSYRLMFFRAAVVSAALALLLAGCGGAEVTGDVQDSPDAPRATETDDTRSAQADGPQVVTAGRSGGTPVEAFGAVSAETTRTISLGFPARIAEVQVENGQRLSRGDTVLVIDMSEFEHEIDGLRDELTIARLEIEAMSADREHEQTRIRNDIAFAERRLAEEEEEYARREARHQSGALSRTELAGYRRNVERLRKDLDDLRLSLERAENTRRIDAEHARARALEATIERMRSRTRTDDLDGTSVMFPFEDGVVTELDLSAGDRLEPGQKAFRALDLQSLFVQADVLEEFISDVEIGASAELVPIADRSRSYRGTVLRIPEAAIARNNETVVPVHITVDDPDAFLRHRFNIDVYIDSR